MLLEPIYPKSKLLLLDQYNAYHEALTLEMDQWDLELAEQLKALQPAFFAEPRHAFLIAEAARFVGLIQFKYMHKHWIPDSIDLEALYINPLFRGKGYARLAIQEGLAFMRLKYPEAIRCSLNVYGKNNTANTLYQTLGFEVYTQTLVLKLD
jgi:GNAT superfamily N-acetyltransferase